MDCNLETKKIELSVFTKYHGLKHKDLKEINIIAKDNKIPVSFSSPGVGGSEMVDLNNLIIVSIGLLQEFGVQMLLETMKFAITLIIQKIRETADGKNKPDLLLGYNDETVKIDYGFDLSKEQQDKLIEKSLMFLQQMIDDNHKI